MAQKFITNKFIELQLNTVNAIIAYSCIFLKNVMP